MKLIFVALGAMVVIAAACPDGYTSTNTHCHDNTHCTANADCNHGEECCFPSNGDCNSMCSSMHGPGIGNTTQINVTSQPLILISVPNGLRYTPGPFPDHFVGWVREARAEEEEGADTELFCSLHRGGGGRGYNPQHPSPTCSFSCQFMGDRPSPVRVVKLKPPPTASRPLPAYYSSAPFAHWSSGVMAFDNVTEDIAGVYQCRSRSGAREATHTISVSVGLDARINTELSNVTFLDDGRVEARCVAKGNPVPNVYIRDSRDSPHDVTYSQLRDVTVTRPRDATSVAVARVHDGRDATDGRLRGFTCVAANNIGGTEYLDEVAMWVAYPGRDDPVSSYYLEHYAGVKVFRP